MARRKARVSAARGKISGSGSPPANERTSRRAAAIRCIRSIGDVIDEARRLRPTARDLGPKVSNHRANECATLALTVLGVDRKAEIALAQRPRLRRFQPFRVLRRFKPVELRVEAIL